MEEGGKLSGRRMDPERAPWFAPSRPNVDRREGLPGRVCKGNWLARHAPGGERQRSASLVDGWFQMVADETVQAGFEQSPVIVHKVLVGVGCTGATHTNSINWTDDRITFDQATRVLRDHYEDTFLGALPCGRGRQPNIRSA